MKLVCLPDFVLCGSKDFAITHGPRGCSPTAVLHIRSGVLVSDYHTRAQLYIPPGLSDHLERCREQNKRFAVCNLGLYPASSYANGHSNALLFDLTAQRIERFEPHGQLKGHARLDKQLALLFSRSLPTWKYLGTISIAPERGVQAIVDAFDGMCVTFSLQYVLLRMLNPSRSPKEVSTFMTRGTAEQLRERVLRLNRYVADTLRSYARGSLTR